MGSLNEQLKNIHIRSKKDTKDEEEQIKIAENIIKPTYFIDTKAESIMGRMMPECYRDINTPNIPVKALNEETLFYIFYAMPETEMQIEAYNEIINKGYFYSTQLGEFVYVKDSVKTDNKVKTILVFNPHKWEKENIDVMFDSKFIDSLQTQKVNV